MIRHSHTIARTIAHNEPYAVDVRLPEWYDHAVCSQTDPESFYPMKGTGGINHIKTAKQVCSTCPVRLQCLQYAVDTGERYGIWGGKTERERRRIRSTAA